jgi:hypothetical protein
MPTTVEAAATKPRVLSGMPKDPANNGRTGLLAMVELKIAKPPMMHKSKNGVNLIFRKLFLFPLSELRLDPISHSRAIISLTGKEAVWGK